MDGMGFTTVIQNLDSLWFFSNALASINPPQPPPSQIPTQITSNNNNHKNDNNTCSISKPSTPKSPITHTNNHQNQPNAGPSMKQSSKQDVSGVEEIEDRDEERSKRKHKMRGWNRMREIRRGRNVDWESVLKMGNTHEEKDDDAMKKHLRSWAIAVAYTAVHDSTDDNNNNTFMVASCSKQYYSHGGLTIS